MVQKAFNKREDRKPNIVNRYVDSRGVSRVQGGRDLKASQHYPRKCPDLISFFVETTQTQHVVVSAPSVSVLHMSRM